MFIFETAFFCFWRRGEEERGYKRMGEDGRKEARGGERMERGWKEDGKRKERGRKEEASKGKRKKNEEKG